jgi:hypothetical protein
MLTCQSPCNTRLVVSNPNQLTLLSLYGTPLFNIILPFVVHPVVDPTCTQDLFTAFHEYPLVQLHVETPLPAPATLGPLQRISQRLFVELQANPGMQLQTSTVLLRPVA